MMNEQELADLFSEQVDHLLQGQPAAVPPDAGEVQELLDIIGRPATQAQFQAASNAQVVFQSQVANWFGLANGGSPMTILGLSKIWFISVVVAVVTVITGGSLFTLVATSIFFFSPVVGPPVPSTATTTATAIASSTPATGTPEPYPSVTVSPETSATPESSTTPSPSPDVSPTIVPSETPDVPLLLPPATLIFLGHLHIPRLCQGTYTTQRTLVNYGNLPVTDSSLVWEVIEGAQLVDTIAISSPSLVPADSAPGQDSDPSPAVTSGDPLIVGNHGDFHSIGIEQDVKLKVKVKVKDDWWEAKSGTEIKIKLSVKHKLDVRRDSGNRYDDDRERDHHGYEPGQIITIVKQDTKWVTFTGFAHPYDNQTLLVDGNIVALSSCTGLPLDLPPGANVSVIGLLQPDGTFLAINITIINITIINGEFDSGVPMPGPDDGDGGSGGSRGGSRKGGSRKGGSRGGSGGSRGSR